MRFTNSIAVMIMMTAAALYAHNADGQTYTDPKKADAGFAIQGEYVSDLEGGGERWGVQVVALGGGKFSAVAYQGGLPGDGWNQEVRREAEGQRDGSTVVLKLADGGIELVIEDGEMAVLDGAGDEMAMMKKVDRKSPTLGAKPPAGAVVLFDGKTAENFERGRMTDDGLLMQGATSKQKFQSITYHIEFQLPYMPDARGQGRGNSGCYFQGRYEVQMLDSFGLEGKSNECGGIYGIAKPQVNMCYPPLAWQTYDVEFTAAKYEGGNKVKNARITVRHNGVVIHKDQELPKATTSSPTKEGPGPGSIHLQNHSSPVRYRNIWLVEKT